MVNELRGPESSIYVGLSCLFTQLLAKAVPLPWQQLYHMLLRLQHTQLLILKTTASQSARSPFC